MKVPAEVALCVVALVLAVQTAFAATTLGGSGPAPFQPIQQVLEISSTSDAEAGWTFKIVAKFNNDVPLPTSPGDCNPVRHVGTSAIRPGASWSRWLCIIGVVVVVVPRWTPHSDTSSRALACRYHATARRQQTRVNRAPTRPYRD